VVFEIFVIRFIGILSIAQIHDCKFLGHTASEDTKNGITVTEICQTVCENTQAAGGNYGSKGNGAVDRIGAG